MNRVSDDFKRVEFQYGLVLYRTRRFQSLMDRLGKIKISKPLGWFLLYVMPVAAGLGIYLFLSEFLVIFTPRAPEVGGAIRAITPLAYLGLPGINPYLPIVDGWLALVFAMIVHEGAHGVVARSLGLPVKAAGLLFLLVIPIGAFVDVDEEALKVARARDSGRVLASGAGINFVLGFVFLLLLLGLVSTMTPAANGIAVSSVVTSSPAAAAGIRPGDFITAVDGIPYNNPTLISNSSWYRPGQAVNITLWTPDGTEDVPLRVGTVPSNSLVCGEYTGTANSSQGFIGVCVVGYSGLRSIVSTYTGSLLTRPILYLCIPTFTDCQGLTPFSAALAPFYASSYGKELVPLATGLYWFFFINFNLAIFNALPIYPLDGGQAFLIGLVGATKGKVSEKTLVSVTVAVTVFVVMLILTLPLLSYLGIV